MRTIVRVESSGIGLDARRRLVRRITDALAPYAHRVARIEALVVPVRGQGSTPLVRCRLTLECTDNRDISLSETDVTLDALGERLARDAARHVAEAYEIEPPPYGRPGKSPWHGPLAAA